MIKHLESKQAELLSNISYDEYTLWRAHPLTKALVLQTKIDSYSLWNGWVAKMFSEREDELRAQGVALHLKDFEEFLDLLKPERQDSNA